MIQYRFKRNVLCIFILASCWLIFYNEFLVYSLQRWRWSSLTCRSDKCLRILLVADPQLIGETFDTNFYNNIAIRDSDKFVKKTFLHALDFTKPDVICFMGDLMDEGSVANDSEFKRYVERFHHIYKTHESVQKIHIPGDNDIGGERTDYVSAFKVNRFRDAYNETDITIVRNQFRFIHVNLLTHKYPDVIAETTSTSENHLLNIILSHVSILSYPGLTMKTVLDKFKPNLIFSGHTHLSRVIKYPSYSMESFVDNRIIAIDLSHNQDRNARDYTEIMVPTASYRMGVLNVGHGFAIIDDNHLQYTVLWSPSRFFYLWSYIIWLVLIAVAGLAYCIYRNVPICKRRVSYRFRLMIDTDKF